MRAIGRHPGRTGRGQLLSQRQWWERRVLTAVAAHWGLSPFALVLRISWDWAACSDGGPCAAARS